MADFDGTRRLIGYLRQKTINGRMCRAILLKNHADSCFEWHSVVLCSGCSSQQTYLCRYTLHSGQSGAFNGAVDDVVGRDL